jgi:hypothetical protein
MKSHHWEIPYHEPRYPIHVITFDAAFTRDSSALPFLAASTKASPVNSDVRVFIVNDLTAENGEKNDN